MKRNVSYLLTCLAVLISSSCEKHSWEDQIVKVKEVIRDEDGNVVPGGETEIDQISEKGAKRFFIEVGHDDHGKGHSAEDSE
ncbi:pre-mRNA-splicing factor ISY1 [Akkermansiaceae bacterium]|nr:pre-mRNA-splicing factor ISY1 [Akkermansiaceae bacterium]